MTLKGQKLLSSFSGAAMSGILAYGAFVAASDGFDEAQKVAGQREEIVESVYQERRPIALKSCMNVKLDGYVDAARASIEQRSPATIMEIRPDDAEIAECADRQAKEYAQWYASEKVEGLRGAAFITGGVSGLSGLASLAFLSSFVRTARRTEEDLRRLDAADEYPGWSCV